jgi:alkanesulfonate monooxygenase
MADDILWYIPNQTHPGHRGDDATAGHNSLDTLTEHATQLEKHGWDGALLGTSWGRPDTFTVATALAARTTTFEPLIAVRPGYWRPAHLASAAATLDHLSGGRVRINIVSGQDDLAAYGDAEGDQADRYARTKQFLQIVRRLWTQESVTYAGEHFQVTGSSLDLRPAARPGRPHPRLYFGGASAAAERVAATEADVQLFWGEPLDGIAERIEEAWAEAEAKVAQLAARADHEQPGGRRWGSSSAVGQRRLLELADRGDVLDDILYTAPGRAGGGGAGTTWLVGTASEVAEALRKYERLGVTHFVLSDTPYLPEIERQGSELVPLLRG